MAKPQDQRTHRSRVTASQAGQTAEQIAAAKNSRCRQRNLERRTRRQEEAAARKTVFDRLSEDLKADARASRLARQARGMTRSEWRDLRSRETRDYAAAA